MFVAKCKGVEPWVNKDVPLLAPWETKLPTLPPDYSIKLDGSSKNVEFAGDTRITGSLFVSLVHNQPSMILIYLKVVTIELFLKVVLRVLLLLKIQDKIMI